MRWDEIISGVSVERREGVSIERSGRGEDSTGPTVLQCRKMRGEVRQRRLRRSGQPGR